MIRAKLCNLVAVLNKFNKVKFELCSYNTPYSFEGTVKEFLQSRLYQIYACEYVSELTIHGDCVRECIAHIKLAPPID